MENDSEGVVYHLFPPREPRRMANGGRVGEFPHQVIGDQRLPVRVVIDEGLEMSVQEIGGDRHCSLLVHLGDELVECVLQKKPPPSVDLVHG